MREFEKNAIVKAARSVKALLAPYVHTYGARRREPPGLEICWVQGLGVRKPVRAEQLIRMFGHGSRTF